MADDRRNRFKELYAEQEQLRLEHNEWGRRFREKEITEVEWKNYLRTSFNPNSHAISKELGETRRAMLTQFKFKLQPITPSHTKYPAQINTDEKKMHYLLVLTHKLANITNIDMEHPLYVDASNKMHVLKEKFKSGI